MLSGFFPESSLRAMRLWIRSPTVAMSASSPSSPLQNRRRKLFAVAAGPGALRARVHACLQACRQAWK
eukprot:5456254-Pyramimonas_sp.AAC.1